MKKNNFIFRLEIGESGHNEVMAQRRILTKFVLENWHKLFEGAAKIGCAIPSDYYAPERIQLGSVRLHQNVGVKYAGTWQKEWAADSPPTYSSSLNLNEEDNNLMIAYDAIMELVRAYERPIYSQIRFTIV